MKGIESAIEPLLADLRSDEHLPHGAEEAVRRAIAESPYLNRKRMRGLPRQLP